jgi:Lar family restriction alleviation protein
MKVELKPCPFCGGEAEIKETGDRFTICIVGCRCCGCRLESNEEGDDCGKEWNTRHVESN